MAVIQDRVTNDGIKLEGVYHRVRSVNIDLDGNTTILVWDVWDAEDRKAFKDGDKTVQRVDQYTMQLSREEHAQVVDALAADSKNVGDHLAKVAYGIKKAREASNDA